MIQYFLLDIWVHYWAEDNFLVSLHYGVNDYPLNSSPNSDHWNLIKPHSHDTDWALPSSLSQSQPPCPAGPPIWLPRRAARIGTRSSPGPHQWTERPGFCVVWTRWIWCKCFWSNLRDSRSDKRLVIWTCRWAGRTRVLSSAALLGPDGGHSAASRRHCFRRWGSRTTFYRLVRPTWSILFSYFSWFFKVFFWESYLSEAKSKYEKMTSKTRSGHSEAKSTILFFGLTDSSWSLFMNRMHSS